MGLLIVFEGGEGCGKSTQVKRLYSRLEARGISVMETLEPGGTSLGDRIRDLVKMRGEVEISPMAELFLFLASRHQLYTEVLRDNEGNRVVICDRYGYSSVAYQGYGRGLDPTLIEQLNGLATQGHLPDLVVLLDLPPEIGLARKRGTEEDHFEDIGLAFHERVREGYLKMAGEDPDRWLVVDAALPEENVEQIIWERVEPLVDERSRKVSG